MALAPYSHIAGLIAQNSAENGTSGSAVTTGNSGGASGTAFTQVQLSGTSTINYTNSTPLDTLAMRVTSNGGLAIMRWDEAVTGTQTDLYGSAYLRIVAYPSSSTAIIEGNLADGGGQSFRIRVLSTGFIRLSNNADATLFTTATNAIALNTWVRLEWHINTTTGAYDVWLYDSMDSTTAVLTRTGTSTFGTSIKRMNFGRTISPELTIDFDNIAIATEKLGPRQVPGTTGKAASLVSNAGSWTATGGTTLAVIRDASDATYVGSPDSPNTAAIRYKLEPLSLSGPISVVTRGYASNATETISRTVAIYNGATLLVSDTFNLTTSVADRTTTTPASVAAGVELEVLITDDAL